MIDYCIEEEFLSLLLINPHYCKDITLAAECILDNDNRFIFQLIKQQYHDYKTVAVSGIAENYGHLFKDKNHISSIIMKITNILNEAMPSSNLEYYQSTLFSRYIKYEIIKCIDLFKTNKLSYEELINKIHKMESISMSSNGSSLSEREIFQLISQTNKNINFRLKHLSENANIQEHDFVIVSARPGIGKSGFLLNLLEDLSKSFKCLFFNMEMAEKQVYQRLISINSNVPMKYHDNLKTEYQKNIVLNSCKELAKRKIIILSSGQTITSIRRKIISESKDEHIIVFIDYVGLIGSNVKYSSLYEKITAIVKELRQISLDYNCTIFLAAQLNRNSENQKDSKPKISDLKESGELEQSATTVLMLHDENHGKNVSKNEIEMMCIIGKNRNGKVGIAKLKYNKESQKFDEL